MRHFEFEELSRFIEKDLPDSEAAEMRQHLDECSDCRKKLEQLTLMIKNLGEMKQQEAPARIFAVLRREIQPPVRTFSPRRWFVGARALIAASLLLIVCGYLTYSSLNWNKSTDVARKSTQTAEEKQSGQEVKSQPPADSFASKESLAGKKDIAADADKKVESLSKDTMKEPEATPVSPAEKPLAGEELADKANANQERDFEYSRNKAADKQSPPPAVAKADKEPQLEKIKMAETKAEGKITRGDFEEPQDKVVATDEDAKLVVSGKDPDDRELSGRKVEKVARDNSEKDRERQEVAGGGGAGVQAAERLADKKVIEPVVKLREQEGAPQAELKSAEVPTVSPGIVQPQPDVEKTRLAMEEELKKDLQKTQAKKDLAKNNAGTGLREGKDKSKGDKVDEDGATAKDDEQEKEMNFAGQAKGASERKREVGYASPAAVPTVPAKAPAAATGPLAPGAETPAKQATKAKKASPDMKSAPKEDATLAKSRVPKEFKKADERSVRDDIYSKLPGGEAAWKEILKKHNTEDSKIFHIYIESWKRISFSSPSITDGKYSRMHNRAEAEAVLVEHLKTMPPVAEVMLAKNININDKGFGQEIDEIAQWLISKGIGNIQFRQAMSRCMPPVVRIYKDGVALNFASPTSSAPEKQ